MPILVLALAVRFHLAASELVRSTLDATEPRMRRLSGDRGQATTEYALVLLAAALVALLVVAWATAGGGSERVSRLFNRAIDAVIDRV